MSSAFVSYPSEYTAHAERLVTDLRASGHDIWWDVERIDIGDSVVARLNDALGESAYLILCLGSSQRSAPWRDREWMAALALQVSHSAIKILPAAVTTEPLIPPILADLAYADLAADWNVGVRRLDKAMRR